MQETCETVIKRAAYSQKKFTADFEMKNLIILIFLMQWTLKDSAFVIASLQPLDGI